MTTNKSLIARHPPFKNTVYTLLCCATLIVSACGGGGGSGGGNGIGTTSSSSVSSSSSSSSATAMLSVFAGQIGGKGNMDATGTNARFYGPEGITSDSAGNLYVTDRSNQTIRKITPAGVVTTLAGAAGEIGSADGTGSNARFWEPSGIAVDSSGNVYVADMQNSTIRKITQAGVVTTIAGTPGQSNSVDGTGAAAQFIVPYGIAVDATGNLFVTDTAASTIRKVTPAGVVTTAFGTTNQPGLVDGVGTNARFSNPRGITIDSAGNLYVTDSDNHTIRKITPAGMVTTLAGNGQPGTVDGTGANAQFTEPFGISVDGAGNLYVADFQNSAIRKVTAAGVVTTLAGIEGQADAVDGTGINARFRFPTDVVADISGNLYVADQGNNTIRKISSAAVVSTFAGSLAQTGAANGTGTTARFNSPIGIVTDSTGNLFVTDVNNHTIREITSAGVVSTFAGSPGQSGSNDGIGTNAQFLAPYGLAIDANGNMYVSDTNNYTIRKITSAGVVTTLAGSAGHPGSVDGTGSSARFLYPSGVAVDSAGNIYVADSGNATIRKITSAGVVSTLAGAAGIYDSADGTGSDARFENPYGIVIDVAGNLYVTDPTANTIRKVTLAGVVTTLAGSGQTGSLDGAAAVAQFNAPCGIAMDASGNLYVADFNNDAIRKITPTGIVTTVIGRAGVAGFTTGALPGVIANPNGVVVYGTVLYATMDNAVIKLAPLP